MLTKEDVQFLAQAVVTATKVFNPETTSQGSAFYQKASQVLSTLEKLLEDPRNGISEQVIAEATRMVKEQ